MRKEKYRTGQNLAKVSSDTAKQRLSVCKSCKYNKEIPKGCGACIQAMQAMRRELIAARALDESLGGCAVLGVDIPTAAHLDEVRIDNPSLPAHCWRKAQL
jgi:hypothetical protein